LTKDKLANNAVFVNMAGFVCKVYKGYGGMLWRFKRLFIGKK